MSPVAIPRWNARGVIPPISQASPTSTNRSPYVVSLSDLVLRYATSRERIAVLSGFLNFRTALHAAGLVRGFQWVDGSFLEDVELIERRPPADIDVVTFYYLPVGSTQQQLLNASPQLFDHARTKTSFEVDAYFSELSSSPLEPLIRTVSYWYSLWSHRRDALWKGYLQLDLAPNEDTTALATLRGATPPGGQP
jgi:hypothetical protein